MGRPAPIYEAELAAVQAKDAAAEAERRKITYSASAPIADTPEAVIGAVGRTMGRCEDALEEVLYHGKFGSRLENRMAALTIMPAYAHSMAQLGGAVLRWNALTRAALIAGRDDPPTEEATGAAR